MHSGASQLREWLKRSKLNQREAALKIGVDFTSLNKIVLGNRRPGLDYALKIERATGIPVEAWESFEADDAPTGQRPATVSIRVGKK